MTMQANQPVQATVMGSDASINSVSVQSLGWLSLGYLLLLLVQFERQDVWLMLAVTLLAGWRWLALAGKIRLPGRFLRLLLVFSITGAFVAVNRGPFSVDLGASFFLLTLGLKWIELHTRRDFYVLFFILCYLAGVNFLFSQALLAALINFTGVILLFNALQWLNGMSPALRGRVNTWRSLLWLLLRSAPILVLLFVFFPRIGPLWSVPLVSNQHSAGLNDEISPGDIANLAQSSARAFRVRFGGDIPQPKNRYWQGLHLDLFDGRTWRSSESLADLPPGKVLGEGSAQPLLRNQYDVLMEPTFQRWGFALQGAQPVTSNLMINDEGLLRFRRPVDTLVAYRVATLSRALSSNPEASLTPAEQRRYTSLPTGFNPRARQLARQLAADSRDPADLALQLMRKFEREPYFYTLQPPLLGEMSVDELLFDSRRGFCSHYASATTFVLRAAGIPARLVAGYLGGEVGIDGDYLIVRQYDAHAWVEMFIAGQGWIRLDPTAFIAPSRVEQGLRAAVAEEGSFLQDEWFSMQRYSDQGWLRWLNLQTDAINYQWQRWVVGYQGQQQFQFLAFLKNRFSPRDWALMTSGLLGLGFLIYGIVSVWRRQVSRQRDPWQTLYHRWVRLLDHYGIQPHAGDSPNQLATRAAAFFPQHAAGFLAFAAQFNRHYYAQTDRAQTDDLQLQRLRRRLKTLESELRVARKKHSRPYSKTMTQRP